MPPYVDVWRSVRVHGDTKTKKSRRSLALPKMVVEALSEQLERQAAARQRAGVLWQDKGLVFTTALGTRLDAADVRRSLRPVITVGAEAMDKIFAQRALISQPAIGRTQED